MCSITPRSVPRLALPLVALCLGCLAAVFTVAYLLVGWFAGFAGAVCGLAGIATGLTVLLTRGAKNRKLTVAATTLSGIGLALFILKIFFTQKNFFL